jgi:lysophospholipase L1-like esterase
MRRSPVRRIRTAGAVVGAVAALVLVTASAAHAAGTSYVALGDSYSSGVGSGSYLATSGDCRRSTKAYPALWAAAHSSASYASLACSGATTADVVSNQVAALDASTTLVSITVGGNDVGFSTVMTDCVVSSTSTCVREVNVAEQAAGTTLPAGLDDAYDAIRSHAPNARVVVLSYPRLYHVGVWYCLGLSDTARAKLNEGADVLDQAVQNAAARHGFGFADVRQAFGSGHEICDGNSWLHSLDWADIDESYHPTASGQSGGYLPAFSSAAG